MYQIIKESYLELLTLIIGEPHAAVNKEASRHRS